MEILRSHNIKRLLRFLFFYCKHTKESLVNLQLGIYWFWAGLRVFMTLMPQTGYIHPDEFFQTVEVFAGNAFGTEVSLPWEFNSTFPIRSAPLIYTAFYIPFSLLRKFSDLMETLLGFSIINHYFLLVIPRLFMCLISFTSDVCLFKICYFFGQNYKERLVLYASSFVCLVFMTRTFTNTIEITCFNILLCLVASCMAESEKVLYQNNFLKDKYNKASTIPDQVKLKKLMKTLPKHSIRKCVPIAMVTVAGFFNRPTFILFAVTPLFYWFQRGLDSKSKFLMDFHLRMFVFCFCCIPVVCFFICFDSAYYGYITWGEIFNMKISLNNFVVTPLNFIQYNIDSSNLSKHGLHPRFLHVLINIPLLFNVLGISGLLVIAKLFYRRSCVPCESICVNLRSGDRPHERTSFALKDDTYKIFFRGSLLSFLGGSFSNWTLLPKPQSITGMMTLSVIVPVFGLSLFPHQEPRFITPILLPLIFLYSHIVRDFKEDCKILVPFQKRHPKRKEPQGILKYPVKCVEYIEKATENFDNRYNVSGRYLAQLKDLGVVEETTFPKSQPAAPEHVREEEKTKKKALVQMWYLLNGFCVLFFGFIHQGGIYGLSKTFHERLLVKPKYMTYHLVTSHSYSLPIHLLHFKKHNKYKNTNFIHYELGSESFDKINLRLTAILKVSEAKKKAVRRNYQVFYALPGSMLLEFKLKDSFRNFTYEIQENFYPHFSSEAPPQFLLNVTDKDDFRLPGVFSVLNYFDTVPVRYIVSFLKQFRLVLVQVKLRN